MIRRMFWLAAGAVLGITGYRRLARLARAIVPGVGAGAGAVPPGGAARPGPGRLTRAGLPARLPAQFLGRPASLPARLTGARQAGSQTMAFVRDVRVGMAEYLDARGEYMNRQTRRPGNNLVSQRSRGTVRAPGSDDTKDGR